MNISKEKRPRGDKKDVHNSAEVGRNFVVYNLGGHSSAVRSPVVLGQNGFSSRLALPLCG